MKGVLTVLLLAGGLAAILAALVVSPGVGHPVTPLMADAANAASGRRIVLHLDKPSSRPQIVFFILPGCPCSDAYEPLTHQLASIHSAQADFVGVVAGTEQDARAWKRDHNTPFPVIADHDRSVARRFDAKRSAYTALLLDGKTITRLWPGYSSEMLNEVSSIIARHASLPTPQIDTSEAPDRLTSGCLLHE